MKSRPKVFEVIPILVSATSLLVSILAYKVGSDSYKAVRADKDVERRLQQHAQQIDTKSHIIHYRCENFVA